jgi:hypothetical protein
MTYVLRWIGRGWDEPDSKPHYLYKSVGKDRRHGWLKPKVTPTIEQARQWATRAGAEGYCARLAGAYRVEPIDQCEECGAEHVETTEGLCAVCYAVMEWDALASTHEILTGTGTTLEMHQDLLPGVGVCRYCGIAPGPVCSAYACVMREGKDDVESDRLARIAAGEDDEYDGQWYGLDKLDADPKEGE